MIDPVFINMDYAGGRRRAFPRYRCGRRCGQLICAGPYRIRNPERTADCRCEKNSRSSPWSVERPGGRLVRELANGVGDPAPHGLAAVIVLRGELVAASSAFLKGLVAVALEHEVGGAPDVDLGYHGNRLHVLDR